MRLRNDVLDAGDLKVMEATKFELGRVREIMEVLNTYFVTEEVEIKHSDDHSAADGAAVGQGEKKVEG
ncbi:MAG: hypothetical protein IPG71_12225 [bacterium]|nr:hypothetical protein [bacterium]